MNKKIVLIGIITLIIDQVTKIIIDMTIEANEVITVIKNFFDITRVGNTGAAFSMLSGNTFILMILSLICIILLIRLIKDFKQNKRNIFAFGLLIGGILGNLSDRLFLGYVRDFLKFKIFNYNYPIFNIADSCIVIGVILLIISLIKGDDKSANSSKRLRRTNKIR